ncbi:PAS domain S-box protein [Halorientalis regularis]|uniref:PAS domain S-box protein n=1 Tax=Halorientalis regularis TaxID=660518 RepID=UPI00316AE662
MIVNVYQWLVVPRVAVPSTTSARSSTWPVYTLDPDGSLTFVNATLCAESGYTRSSLIGTHVSEILPEHDVNRCQRAIRDPLETGGRTREVTVTVETQDGEWLTATLVPSSLPLSSGFRGTVGVVRDLEPGRPG